MTEDERAFGRVEARVEHIVEVLQQDREERRALEAKLFGGDGEPGVLERLSGRVGSLERWRAYVAGVVGVILAAFAWIIYGR